ncbi:MAG: DUF2200 domain-containing protein [Planctomycetota bacterium]
MKQPPPESIERAKKMTFASIYPLYLARIEKNGKTEKELQQVIKWLTGYDAKKLKDLIKDEATFDTFVKKAKFHPNAHLITGTVCGYRVEEIKDPFMRKLRQLEKLIDELARGKKMQSILRSGD